MGSPRHQRQQRRPELHPGHWHVRLPRAHAPRQPVPGPDCADHDRQCDPGFGLQPQPYAICVHTRPRGPAIVLRRTSTASDGPVRAPAVGLSANDIALIMPEPIVSSTARNLLDVGHPRRSFPARHVACRGRRQGHLQHRLELRNLGQLRPVRPDDAHDRLPRPAAVHVVDGRRPNPVTGAIQCRSQFDPTAAVRTTSTRHAIRAARAQAAKLAADIAACVPYNPFGAADNSRCDPLLLDATRSRKAQDDAARLPRLRQRRIRASCSSFRAARSASCSAANIAAKRPSITKIRSSICRWRTMTNDVDVGNFDPPSRSTSRRRSPKSTSRS